MPNADRTCRPKQSKSPYTFSERTGGPRALSTSFLDSGKKEPYNMTEQEQQQRQNEPLYTLTVEMIHQKTSPKWLTVGLATDTLAHLVEWAAPANPQITPPEAPLTTETVRQFVAAVAAQPDYEWQVHIEPAPEDARATLDELEDFAHRCENGTVTVEDMDRHDKLSTLYFKPARMFMFDAGS